MSQKRKRSPEQQSDQKGSSAVFRSAPIEDRSSKFVGYFSPSLKPKDLQQLDEFASASHKMLAWRRESNQQAINGSTKYVTDNDDDGEKYGGKKIEKVLQSMQVSGACVVARWYGGVLLGPVRFDHIENCAKEAVKKWQDSVIEEGTKRLKAEVDAHDKEVVVNVLAERDESITVLRTMAAEKEQAVKQAKAAEDDSAGLPVSDESKPNALEVRNSPDYAAMPLEQLKKIEKARDATLSFLLKRIDKAEAELKTRDSDGKEEECS